MGDSTYTMFEISIGEGIAIKSTELEAIPELISYAKDLLKYKYENELGKTTVVRSRSKQPKANPIFNKYIHYAEAYALARRIPKKHFSRACTAGQLMMFIKEPVTEENRAELEKEWAFLKARGAELIDDAFLWLKSTFSNELTDIDNEFLQKLTEITGKSYVAKYTKEQINDPDQWAIVKYLNERNKTAKVPCDKEYFINGKFLLNLLKNKASYQHIKETYWAEALARIKTPYNNPLDETGRANIAEACKELDVFDDEMKDVFDSIAVHYA